MKDAPIPQSSLWPFAGFTPVCSRFSCSSETSAEPALQPDLCSAEQGGRMSSLQLLAALLMQSGMLLPFFATRVHSWLHDGAWGYSSPDGGLSISLCWTSRDPSLPNFPACRGPSQWQHNHLEYEPLLITLVICRLAEGELCACVQLINGVVKLSWPQYRPLRHWLPPPWAWHFNQFLIQLEMVYVVNNLNAVMFDWCL